MVDGGSGREGGIHEGDRRGGGTDVVLRGMVARRPRGIRTVEGWEVASLLIGSDDAGGPEGGAVLVVCTGAGSSRVATRVAVGDEVIVMGRLVPRRGARPEDDAIELVADAVLARSGGATVAAASTEPRIAP